MPFAQTELVTVLKVFNETVSERMQTLMPPSMCLAWLSNVMTFLSFLHTEAEILISELNLEPEVRFRLSSWYLNVGAGLLQLCDIVNSEVKDLRTRCLLLSNAVYLTRPNGERLKDQIHRAKEHLSGVDAERSFCPKRFSAWRGKTEEVVHQLKMDLEKLTHAIQEIEEILSAERTAQLILHAVGALTVLLAGASASLLTRSPLLVRTRVAPGEFEWSETFAEIERHIHAELKRRFGDKEGGEELELLDDVGGLERQARWVLHTLGDEARDTKEAARELLRTKERVDGELRRLKSEEGGLFMRVVDIRNEQLQKIL